jgi:hypothetical protein
VSGDSLIECAAIALSYFTWSFNASKIHPWTDSPFER